MYNNGFSLLLSPPCEFVDRRGGWSFGGHWCAKWVIWWVNIINTLQTLLFMTIKLQQEIQETWTCWIHHKVERRKEGTKRSTSETKVHFTQLSIYLACMNSLCVVSSYKRGWLHWIWECGWNAGGTIWWVNGITMASLLLSSPCAFVY